VFSKYVCIFECLITIFGSHSTKKYIFIFQRMHDDGIEINENKLRKAVRALKQPEN
jgi:hypothetical protein